MQDDADNNTSPPALTFKHQALAVAGFTALAGVVLFFFLLSPGSGQPAEGQGPRPAYFVPGNERAASLRLERIERRHFHTETVTDGYIAANGGWSAAATAAGNSSPGTPVLAGQSADLLQAESDLVTARAQLRTATANEDRQHKLYQTDGAA
ncbi:MAG TPA: hypothetical protein VN175_10915, partial [Rhizomicrobium sp.]|nr:hypothetical protein [Rhizomicrobium sp.]